MSEIDWDGTIEEIHRGWGKGAYGADENGRYPGHDVCLLGAISVASGLGWVEASLAAETAVIPVIREQFPERCLGLSSGPEYHVPTFNDHPDTTLDDVLLVLEKARAHE